MILRLSAICLSLWALAACAPFGAVATADAEGEATEASAESAAREDLPPGPATRAEPGGPPVVADTPLGDGPRRTVMNIVDQPAAWNGDATTGGLWIALPYAPVRRKAVVVNPETGAQAVVTLLWRDPREGDGPTLLSSAAARALGVAPGGTTPVDVRILSAE